MERYNDIRGIRLTPLISPQSVLSPAHPPHTKKTLPSHTRWCKMILWIYFTLGNIFGFRAESRSEGTARALTPDQQDGVGEKPLLLLQKNLFFQTLCRQVGKTALYPKCPVAKKLRTTLALPLKSLWAQKKSPAGMGELDKQMQEIVELLNSATPEQRNAVETLLRSRAKPE